MSRAAQLACRDCRMHAGAVHTGKGNRCRKEGGKDRQGQRQHGKGGRERAGEPDVPHRDEGAACRRGRHHGRAVVPVVVLPGAGRRCGNAGGHADHGVRQPGQPAARGRRPLHDRHPWPAEARRAAHGPRRRHLRVAGAALPLKHRGWMQAFVGVFSGRARTPHVQPARRQTRGAFVSSDALLCLR